MPLDALALALAAAVLHAVWNLLLARARDSEAATAVAMCVAVVAYAPVAAALWRVEAEAAPYVAGTAALHLLYFALLGAAYRRAELSVVYPLSRGLAPVLVLIVGAAVLGAGTSAGEAAGVCVIGLGVLAVHGLRRPAEGRGAAFGLVIAACIAAYTLNDNTGVEHANPIAYLELGLVVPTIVYASTIAARRGGAALRAELGPATIVAGLATFGAYALVLAALQRAPAAPVAAVRETSVVIATVLAASVLGERVGPLRLGGAVAVAAGIALLTL